MSLVKCRVCGYIIEESKLKSLCPACGVKNTAFEPHIPKLTEKRRKLLKFHIHPVMTHFTESSIVLLNLFIVLVILSKEFNYISIDDILVLIYFFSLFQLVFAVFTMITGIKDGKLRFNTTKTPYLRKKIIVGAIYIIISIILFILTLAFQFRKEKIAYLLLLTIPSLVCAYILGRIGGELICTSKK